MNKIEELINLANELSAYEELEVITDPSVQKHDPNLDLRLPVGKHNHMPDGEFDPRELETGIQVEMEHTDDRNIAKAIARDHLYSCPKYYTYLLAMEKEHGCED